jgi:hypothetical protein
VSNDINILQSALLNDIQKAISGWCVETPYPSNYDLEKIAVGIQLWGANTGRSPLVRGGGFHANFNVTAYRKIISHLLLITPSNAITGCPHLQSAIKLWQSSAFHYFGVSFVTKHFSFWSQAKGMPTLLPIYDNIMAKHFMGRCVSAHWRDYVPFVENMHTTVRSINDKNPILDGQYTVIQLERALFNWANKELIAGWIRCPIGSLRSTRLINSSQENQKTIFSELGFPKASSNKDKSKVLKSKNKITT